MAPWLQLSSGPKDASRTVLLDYISPFPTTAVYQAVRYKDFYVAAAILVTVILRVLIVLSTTLITLVPVSLELYGVPATLQHTFRTTARQGWPLPEVTFDPRTSVKAQVYLGLLKGEHRYPIGLTESLAYQDFSVDSKGVKHSTLAVDAFTVETENCTYFLNLTFPENSSRTQYYGRVLLSSCFKTPKFFNSTYIDENMDRLFASYGAYLGYLLFRDQTENSTANATVIVESGRLLVTSTVAHVMTGLLGLCFILSLSMIALLPKRDTLPPRPTTIMDIAVLAHQSQPFTQSFRNLGASSKKALQSQIHSRNYKTDIVRATGPESKNVFVMQVDSISSPECRASNDQKMDKTRHPLVLHSVTRLIFTFLVISIIITLEIMLRRSELYRGLMDVGSKDYIQYGWVFLPAIILSLISLYYGTVEFQIRLLAPYQNLSLGAPSRVTLFLDLRDKLSVTAFVTAVRTRQYAVATAILTAFTTSFLTIASASLFSVQQVSADKVPTQLVPQDILNYTESWASWPDIPTSLLAPSANWTSLLASGLDFPAFTFQDLVYPTLSWDKSVDGLSSNSTQDIYVEADIPAARSSLNCTVYTRPHLEAKLGAFSTNAGKMHYIHVKFPKTDCTGPEGNFRIQIDEPFTTRDFYFGIALPGSSLLLREEYQPPNQDIEDPHNFVECTSYLYAWGKVSNWTGNDLSLVGMGCDEQMQVVNTKLTLFGPDLEIRHDHPPQLDNSSVHTVAYAPKGCRSSVLYDCGNALEQLYMYIPNVLPSEALDPFFSILTFPGGLLALDQSLLGNESMSQSVADAVIYQHQVLRGQKFSSTGRSPINTPDTRSTTVSAPDSHVPSFAANISDVSRTTNRIIQDALATRILEALLGTVLALSCLSWIASPNTNVLPRDPVSIASVVAWLADGDIIDMLPHNVHEMTKAELKAFFNDEYFYLRMDQQGRFGICSALATFTKERASQGRRLSSANS
ncbi:hypothetical protein NUW58_g4655 [Xylaria curta]|uniref:Uncharacterized protein n=1 Tax=Xylaria curta TaxID=42375 RepID=A0ACC1P7Y8_9PEZI|nr:hypothetical protein NUW58_g4655 [Xylaria curta]